MKNTDLRKMETWVFDLDNTLYCASSNLFGQISTRMTGFIADFLGVDEIEAFRVQKGYFQEYGTTLRGLMSCHNIDPYHFMDHVHDIDLGVIAPDPALEAALASLQGRKIIFTNGSCDHANRVMARLGIGHHFEGVFDIADAGFVPKPEPDVYRQLVERHKIAPRQSVMVEDMARNLKPAAALGMTTVWVRTETVWGREGSEDDYIDHRLDNLSDWLTALPA